MRETEKLSKVYVPYVIPAIGAVAMVVAIEIVLESVGIIPPDWSMPLLAVGLYWLRVG